MTAKELNDNLLKDFPDSRPRLTEFPTGAFMVDIEINGVAYVAEYLVGKGYGLSKRDDATYGWEGVDKAFASIEVLAEYIFFELNRGRVK